MAAEEVTISLNQRRLIAQFNVRTDEFRNLLGGADEWHDNELGIVTFAVAPAAQRQELGCGLVLDSTARALIPSRSVDSDDVALAVIDFYVGDRVAVVLSGEGDIAAPTLLSFVTHLVDLLKIDLDGGQSLAELEDLGVNAGWAIARLLRARIRDVERSVREALEGEVLSHAAYEALRDYPERLAKVDALSSAISETTWDRHRSSRFVSAVVSEPSARDLADEARMASAQLSGLVSSQQVVVAQRQTAETARFQRLVTLLGTAVLVPGLIAAIFGANVNFRGRDTSEGFWAMGLLMLGGGLGAYAFFRSLEGEMWPRIGRALRVQKLSEGQRVAILMTMAAIVAAVGVAILFC